MNFIPTSCCTARSLRRSLAQRSLVELKVNPQYDRRDEAQLLNVLKAIGIKVGLLVNFGRTKVEDKRLIF